jgi:hypothetical protein
MPVWAKIAVPPRQIMMPEIERCSPMQRRPEYDASTNAIGSREGKSSGK